ncbi:acetyl-CoA carboxylase biotin carboxylase subunit [Amedibacillus sp. YH-ame10]
MIKRLLIANRGEIAVRIIRTCKEMGIETVAVYSTADHESLHVQLADYAVCIGGPKSNDSYLNMKNILSAACMTGCDAIHPGFGFLSENAKFARLVMQCGLIFIGPNPDVIDQMGDKNNARQKMMEAKVPVIPGSKDILQSVEEAKDMAESIGFPVLIKASNGGGGRGMRRVDAIEELENAYQSAKAEAKANFGDDAVYMEKFIIEPKHVEVQLLADKHGNVLHLFERDCSCQRRNQKLLEEAPCHILQDEIRQQLLSDAVKACKSVGYDSVGTIEFLLDARGQYYFMEMNTRIQVEHTISEEITGIDLIKQQILVAQGSKLSFTQEDIVSRGHAIECRINAENIKLNFAPSPGEVKFINFPGGRRVRIESAVYNGYKIPPYYDSMIAKVITYADTRLECIKRMRVALEELLIEGVETNIEFQYLLLHHPTFVSGKYDTGFMETFIKELKEDGTII